MLCAAAPSEQSPGKQWITAKLKELDGFKSKDDFRRLGFGRGGPYYKWLEAVEKKREDKTLPPAERIAVSDLWSLGTEYMKTRGQETKDSKYFRAEIMHLIGPPKSGN
jgi:hypothetical protein